MYESYYRFLEKPFSLTPDPKFLYLSKQHQGALEHMLYGVSQREGFMAIVGDVGTGKTTLCRCLLDRLEKNIKVALILNPLLSDMDLLRTCVHDLKIRSPRNPPAKPVLVGAAAEQSSGPARYTQITSPETDWIQRAGKKDLLDALNEFLLEQHHQGGSTVLILDEAQNLSLEVMEQLRILSNLETEKEKLLQIIFVGQLELNEKLQLPALKQLTQRISVRYEITPLSKDEAKNYINHRILVAGAGAKVTFNRSSLNEIYNYSRGYPRLINLVCDRSLLAGYNTQADTITVAHVKQAIHSLLGEEDNQYYGNRKLQTQLPLAASVVFFLAGMGFFFWAGNKGAPIPIAQTASPAVVAPVVADSAPAPVAEAKPEEPKTAPPIPAVIDKPPVAENVIAPVNPAPVQKAGPVAVPATASAAKSGEFYRIQVVMQDAEKQAEENVKKLQGEGFPAYWKKVESGGKAWFVVYLGPFKDVKSANIHLNALKFSGRKPTLYSVAQSD
jgi:general secretion pathway protein A